MVEQKSASGGSDKILNACDECRTRKLKCSGEPTGCSRCLADGISCHYSPRKQMGRPRKRRREEEANGEGQDHANSTGGSEQDALAGNSNDESTTVSSDQILDPDLLNLDLPPIPNGSAPFNFDFSQYLGSDPLLGFPGLGTTQGTQNVGLPENYNTSQPQTPSVTPNDQLNSTTPMNYPTRCRCLPKLYVTLSAFQSSSPASFPSSMSPLKKASKLAVDVVRCPYCSQDYNSALQNSMLLGTLINLIINDYKRLLEHVDERAAAGEKICLRMGENTPGTAHLHTGMPDCPMGIDIDLDGDEWRLIARKAVSREIYGSSGVEGLAQTIQEMRDRQVNWHSQNLSVTHKEHALGEGQPTTQHGGSTCVCMQVVFIDRLRILLDDLKL